MLYAALGDSITYGYCSTDPSQRYANMFLQQLRAKPSPKLFVHAYPGWTSLRLLKSVQAMPSAIWDETRIVSLMIGGNDLLRAIPFLLQRNPRGLVRVARRLHRNVQELIRIVSRDDGCVLVGTLYNPFPNSPVAERCTVVLNQAIACAAQENGAILADVCAAVTPQVQRCVEGYRSGRMRDFRLVGNPIHPNDEGHYQIATAFHDAYRNAILQNESDHRKSSM